MVQEHLHDIEINDKDASNPVTRHFYLPNHSKQHMAVSSLSLHLGNSESHKTQEQKFIFQTSSPNPHSIKKLFNHSTNLFLFFITTFIAPLSAYKPTHNPQFLQSLRKRANRSLETSAFKFFMVANSCYQYR